MGGMTWLLALVVTQTAPEPRSVPPREEAAPAPRPSLEPAKLPVAIEVRSDLRKRFRLVEARISLDGHELTRIIAPKGEELASSFRAFDGPLGLGRHAITVALTYQGRNAGPFTYLDDYRYRVESSGEFTVEMGRVATINVLAYERPGATVPVEEKPTMVIKAVSTAGTAAAPAAPAPPIIE